MVRRFATWIFLALFVPSLLAVVSKQLSAQMRPSPPLQPASGPGGAQYKHDQIKVSVHGSGSTQYWLFEPAAPQPPSAPLVVFNHGWGAMSPRPYSGWISHIVRRGNIVLYPRYQADLRTPTNRFTQNAIAAIKDGIARLRTEPGRVRPELDKFALVGHSVGGILSPNIAALAVGVGLPEPKAVMSVQPGRSWNKIERASVALEDLSRIPPIVLLLVVAGDQDSLARDVDAKRIFHETTNVPLDRKNYVLMISDAHGLPALEANHFAPLARDDRLVIPPGDSDSNVRPGRLRKVSPEGVIIRSDDDREIDRSSEPPSVASVNSLGSDALDFFGFWKLFDALCDDAFYGKNREYALGNTPSQRFMGKWSDGHPVTELVISVR